MKQLTNFEKIEKSTYQAFILENEKEIKVIIKKNDNTFAWDTFIDGVYKYSHCGLKWAKCYLLTEI